MPASSTTTWQTQCCASSADSFPSNVSSGSVSCKGALERASEIECCLLWRQLAVKWLLLLLGGRRPYFIRCHRPFTGYYCALPPPVWQGCRRNGRRLLSSIPHGAGFGRRPWWWCGATATWCFWPVGGGGLGLHRHFEA